MTRLSRSYLGFYSAVQTWGWMLVLMQTVSAITQGTSVLDNAFLTVSYFQTLMLLEIVHALLGFVKASVVLTAFQVVSRLLIVTHIQVARDAVVVFPWVWMLFMAWSLAECVRYPYYIVQTRGLKIPVITWLRYTMFIILYPIGITGELGILLHTIPTMARISDFPLHYWAYALQLGGWPLIVVLYICIFPRLYMHMFSQRKKMLARKKN